jgi:hypothetical protein
MGRITRGPPCWTRPRDETTSSQVFVRRRVGRRVSLPVVLSPLVQRGWRRHRAKGGVFAFAPTDPQPEWMAPTSEADPAPPPGYVVSFVSFHERGFGVPASRFMQALLHYYGVELHNFNHNSIAQAAIFAAVCEGFLGIDPHWDLWIHLFSAELFDLTTGERKVRMAVRAGGCTLQLRQGRAQQYIPAILVSSNKGWQRRWFYLQNDDGRLPWFSQRVVTAAGSNLRWGATLEKQENLQPLLEALQRLRDGGLTAAGVVTAIHRRRVLPLAERRLPLSEMKPGVDLEGSQMSSAPLSADDLRRRIAGMVGRLDAGALTQPVMHPEHGYVSLVSVRSFSYSALSCL